MKGRPCIHRARVIHESPSKVTVEQNENWVVVAVWRGERSQEGVYRISGELAELQAEGNCVQVKGREVVIGGRVMTLDVIVPLCEPETAPVHVKIEC